VMQVRKRALSAQPGGAFLFGGLRCALKERDSPLRYLSRALSLTAAAHSAKIASCAYFMFSRNAVNFAPDSSKVKISGIALRITTPPRPLRRHVERLARHFHCWIGIPSAQTRR
jgi:hypothetical protein